MSQRRERRTYTQEFKQQMVDLLNTGKPRADIIREYELTPSSFDKWVRQAKKTGSFKDEYGTRNRPSVRNFRPPNAELSSTECEGNRPFR